MLIDDVMQQSRRERELKEKASNWFDLWCKRLTAASSIEIEIFGDLMTLWKIDRDQSIPKKHSTTCLGQIATQVPKRLAPIQPRPNPIKFSLKLKWNCLYQMHMRAKPSECYFKKFRPNAFSGSEMSIWRIIIVNNRRLSSSNDLTLKNCTSVAYHLSFLLKREISYDFDHKSQLAITKK